MHPHPARVIPLHRRGNNIPVAGSFEGESMTGSPPNGTAEHCAIEVSSLLRVVLPAAHRTPAARRRDAVAVMGKDLAVDGLALA